MSKESEIWVNAYPVAEFDTKEQAESLYMKLLNAQAGKPQHERSVSAMFNTIERLLIKSDIREETSHV